MLGVHELLDFVVYQTSGEWKRWHGAVAIWNSYRRFLTYNRKDTVKNPLLLGNLHENHLNIHKCGLQIQHVGVNKQRTMQITW